MTNTFSTTSTRVYNGVPTVITTIFGAQGGTEKAFTCEFTCVDAIDREIDNLRRVRAELKAAQRATK
jgi:hypothetical protein